MFEEVGELLGLLIILMYGFTLLSYVLKFINKHLGKYLRKAPKIYKLYLKLMKFSIKNHRFFGMGAIVFILAHFVIQFVYEGLSISGVIAATLMIIQALLGAFGFFNKPQSRVWLIIHRLLAIIILIAILIHI